MKRTISFALALLMIITMFSACSKPTAPDPSKNNAEPKKEKTSIEKVTVKIPEKTEAYAMLDDAQSMAVGSYLVARMYLEEFLQYDVENGNQKDYEKLLKQTMKAFRNAQVLAGALSEAVVYTDFLQSEGEEVYEGKADILRIGPRSSFLSCFFPTAYAAEESDAMKWAKAITEIYDKAPSNKGVRTLAAQLGTDAKHAYAQLKQAQAILEGGAYEDFADYANTCYKTAYALKAAGTTAGFVVSIAVAGPATGLAAVAQTGGIVMGGVNTVLEVGAAGSVIATNGEGNEVTTFCEKTEAQMAPVGQVFSLMSLGLNGHKLLTGGYKADAAKAAAEGNYSSYLDGVKNDLFGATAYIGTSVYDYMDSGSIMSGTFTKTDKGLEFTLMKTLKGEEDEKKEAVKQVMKNAGVSEETADKAVNETKTQDPPELNEVPKETAQAIIDQYTGIDPAGDFNAKEYKDAVEESYSDLVKDHIKKEAKNDKKDDDTVSSNSKSGSFYFHDGTGAFFDSKTGARVIWTHDENGDLQFIHSDDAKYTVDDDGNIFRDGKPLKHNGQPINAFTGTEETEEPEEEEKDPLAKKLALLEGDWTITQGKTKVPITFTVDGKKVADSFDRTWEASYDEDSDTLTLTTVYYKYTTDGKWVAEDKPYTWVITKLDKSSFTTSDENGTIVGTR